MGSHAAGRIGRQILYVRHHFIKDVLYGVIFFVIDQHERQVKIIPVLKRVKQRNRHNPRFGQRKYDLHKDPEMSCAIHLRAFYEFIRKPPEKITHQIHIKHIHRIRQEHGRIIILHSQIFGTYQIPGKHSAIKQHRKIREESELISKAKASDRQHIGIAYSD